jgi:hypothetical protein
VPGRHSVHMENPGTTTEGQMAGDHVLFIGWNRSVAGRERAALELFQHALGYFGEMKAAGQISSVEPVLLGAHGGDLNGFILVKGDEAKLDVLQHSEKFMDLITRCAVNVEGVGAIRGWSGESLMSQVQRYSRVIQ